MLRKIFKKQGDAFRLRPTKQLEKFRFREMKNNLISEIQDMEKPNFYSYLRTLEIEELKKMATDLLFNSLLINRAFEPNNADSINTLVLAVVFAEYTHNLPIIIYGEGENGQDRNFVISTLVEALDVHYYYSQLRKLHPWKGISPLTLENVIQDMQISV